MPYGPQHPVSRQEFFSKHAQAGETFETAMARIARALGDTPGHRDALFETLLDQSFLPAGRIQRGAGSGHKVTLLNCFVSGTIADSLTGPGSIMQRLTESAETQKWGGGIGFDFSTLRPRNAPIKTLGSGSSGAVSFMNPYNATCEIIQAAGGRRGAMMAVLRVDHPDIREFIHAKGNRDQLTNFNISVAVTNEFLEAVNENRLFDLRFGGEVYETVSARELWDEIMEQNYNWAEPGVLFIDRINEMNNLWYCEDIAATNPCGEQPLPPFGACCLGSINLVKFVRQAGSVRWFDMAAFEEAIPVAVRALDNVIDVSPYPLPEQAEEARLKRRIGLGPTGLANAIEACGPRYGTDGFISMTRRILATLRNVTYRTSIELAREKGSFPMFERGKYLQGKFVQRLPADIQEGIYRHGIRNGCSTSAAPTGTISLTANNVSSGIEPVFALRAQRKIINTATRETRVVELPDYGFARWGVRGVTAEMLPAERHVDVLAVVQEYMDSAVSKTCNVPTDVSKAAFQSLYMRAWEKGAKGCTTYRPAGREGVLKSLDEGAACYVDPQTGVKSCG